MAKYQKLKEPVFVSRVEQRGSMYGGDIYEVDLTGIKSQSTYKTYVDPQNNNFRQWQGIMDAAERKGVVLTNIKLKDPEKLLVNADSMPTVEYVVSKEELAETLAEYWDSQDHYKNLFGDSDDA
jgi:hypothetical protein